MVVTKIYCESGQADYLQFIVEEGEFRAESDEVDVSISVAISTSDAMYLIRQLQEFIQTRQKKEVTDGE